MFGEIFDETIIFAQLMSYYNHLYIKDVDINDRCVTDLSEYFYCCESLESINASKLDTSQVENMYSCFNGCKSLKSLDINDWDVSNVNNMNICFS